jgi:hypothetical protein
VICTPHLGASTTEAQEGVSTEVAEAVIDALQGKLSTTAVNAPLVSAEVLKELAPFVTLAEGLGKVRAVARCCCRIDGASDRPQLNRIPGQQLNTLQLPSASC